MSIKDLLSPSASILIIGAIVKFALEFIKYINTRKEIHDNQKEKIAVFKYAITVKAERDLIDLINNRKYSGDDFYNALKNNNKENGKACIKEIIELYYKASFVYDTVKPYLSEKEIEDIDKKKLPVMDTINNSPKLEKYKELKSIQDEEIPDEIKACDYTIDFITTFKNIMQNIINDNNQSSKI